jgi:mannose-1-phosphate guanylyltransferase/mannose-6-phosphate isomerase
MELRQFVEKPDLDAASKYVDSGEYLWNSGIFMMRVSVLLRSLNFFRNDIMSACMNSYSTASIDGDFVRPNRTEFEKCPAESFDYAVMERATGECYSKGKSLEETPFTGCVVVPLATDWSDVGTWSALLDESEKTQDHNVVNGDVYTLSTKNSLVRSESRLVAAVGLEDAIVVETADAVLVAHKNSVQDVKRIADMLKIDGRSEYHDHLEVHRPWGTYETLDRGQGFQVKRLTIKPGAAISLQKHRHRSEHWVVVEGKAKVTVGNEEMILTANQSTYVSKGTVHRLENPEDRELHIIEVQSGEYLEEDDIVRFDDKYERETQ